MLSVVMLNVANKPFVLNVILMRVVMLNVANKPLVLSAVLLSVVVPLNIREKLI